MAEKIAITVDPELLRQVEALRRRTKESRSAVFNRAARQMLNREAHAEKVERYVEAYTEQPETADEIAAAEAAARISLARLPWSDE